jgi:CBS domain-containing protein
MELEPVSALMSSDVVTVQADDTIAGVSDMLLREGLSFVPVTDRSGSGVLGIISADDLLQFRGAGRDPNAVRAWEICSYKPVEVGPDAPLGEVAKLMVEKQIHHVIVTENKDIVGVVSALDFVKKFVPAEGSGGNAGPPRG